MIKIDVWEVEGWIIKDFSYFKKWLIMIDLKEYFDWLVEEIIIIWYFVEGGFILNFYLLWCVKELGIIFLIFKILRYNLIGCVFYFLFFKLLVLENKFNEVKM